MQGCNRPSNNQVEGCVDSTAVSKPPGEVCLPWGRFSIPGRMNVLGESVRPHGFRLAIVPLNNRLVSCPSQQRESDESKCRAKQDRKLRFGTGADPHRE
jgi:hypothetical protein